MCPEQASSATIHTAFSENPDLAARWPGVAARTIELGGVRVTCEEARAAAGILAASRASAIKSVLSGAGSPLADCDYWSVCRPHMDEARAALKRTGGIGPKGRHLAKNAFISAVYAEIATAACDEIAVAFDAFGTDERYAAAIITDAVKLAQRRAAREGTEWLPLPVISDSDACTGTDDLPAEAEPEPGLADKLEAALWRVPGITAEILDRILSFALPLFPPQSLAA